MVFGFIDKDIKDEHLEDAEIGPALYASLKTENIFNFYTFGKWIGGSFLYSAIVFVCVLFGTQYSIFANGQDSDSLWLKSILVCSCVYCVVNFKCYFEMESFTILHHLAMLLSFFLFYGYNILLQEIPTTIAIVKTTTNLLGVWGQGVTSPIFWFVHMIAVVTPISIEIALHGVKLLVWPDEYQKVKMLKKKNWIKSCENC